MGMTFEEIDKLTLLEYNKLQIVDLYKKSEKQSMIRDIEYAIYHAQGAKLNSKRELYPIPLVDNEKDLMPIRNDVEAEKLIKRVLNDLKESIK